LSRPPTSTIEPARAHPARRARVRLITFVALAGASLLASPAHAQKSPTAQACLGRSYQHLVGDRFADAAAELETAVRFEPRFAYGWYLLASASRRAGDPDRAAFAYRRYAELRPADPDPYFGLGLSLASVGDRAGARAALNKFLEASHGPSSSSFVDEARRRIAALEHDDGKAAQVSAERNGQAAALLAARKFPDAVEFLRGSIALAPADAGAWYKLGFALRQAGQPDEAAKAYRRSITLRPDDADAYYGLGQVLVAAQRPQEALVSFRTYVKAAKDKGDPRWISKARQEIVRLESAPRPARPEGVKPPAAVAPPAAASRPSVPGTTGPSPFLAGAHSTVGGEPAPAPPKEIEPPVETAP